MVTHPTGAGIPGIPHLFTSTGDEIQDSTGVLCKQWHATARIQSQYLARTSYSGLQELHIGIIAGNQYRQYKVQNPGMELDVL
jgi:hypothetical protein